MFRADGRGGIQGIVLDTFYVNKDGRIANEFYMITDPDEGEIKKLDDFSIRKLDDHRQVQAVFYQYFLKQEEIREIASND